MPILLVARDPSSSAPARVELRASRVVLGSAKGADVVLADSSLLAEHVVIRRDAAGWLVEAIGEIGVGEVPLRAGEVCLLGDNLPLRIGAVVFDCHDVATASLSAVDIRIGATAEIALNAAHQGEKLGRDLERFSLVVLRGDDVGKTCLLSADPLSIGRGEGAGLELHSSKISRRHASVRVRDGSVQLRDETATQGTFLGGGRLEPGRWAVWPRGIAARLGDVVLAWMPPMLDAIAKEVESRAAHGAFSDGAPSPHPPQSLAEAEPTKEEPPVHGGDSAEEAVPVAAAHEPGAGAPIARVSIAAARDRGARSWGMWASIAILAIVTFVALVWIFLGSGR